jgi:hypothetical protein
LAGKCPYAAPIRCSVISYEAHRPAQECSSGVQLRRGWLLQGQLDWFTGVLAANVEWSFSRLFLARMQIGADLSAPGNPTQSIVPPRIFLSHHVPCRLRSSTAWYFWRSLLALIRSYWSAFVGESRRSHAHQSDVNWHQTFSMSPCQYYQ